MDKSASQQFKNCWAIFPLILFFIYCILSKFKTGSIAVNALNVNGISSMMIYHGPIRSTTASSHSFIFASFAPNVHVLCFDSLLLYSCLHICIPYNIALDKDDKILPSCFISIWFLLILVLNDTIILLHV